MLEGFPTTRTLKDGAEVSLRPMTRDDEHDVARFFAALPEGARRYLRNDVTDRKLIARWMRELDYEKILPLLAEYRGRIVASASIHRQTFGWGRHVAEVRVVIHPAFQGRGLGAMLLDEMSRVGSGLGLRKLVARIVSGQGEVIKAFERAGFAQVAVLERYVKDAARRYADVTILVKELAPGAPA